MDDTACYHCRCGFVTVVVAAWIIHADHCTYYWGPWK
jgi:hypothetical protein